MLCEYVQKVEPVGPLKRLAMEYKKKSIIKADLKAFGPGQLKGKCVKIK